MRVHARSLRGEVALEEVITREARLSLSLFGNGTVAEVGVAEQLAALQILYAA